MSDNYDLHGKILDIILVVRDITYRFQQYSSQDIRHLISSSMNMTTKREPGGLQHLYTLEGMITNLRITFHKAKGEAEA